MTDPTLAEIEATRPRPWPAPTSYPIRRHLLSLAAGFIIVSGLLVAATLTVLHDQAIESGERLTESFALVVAEETSRTAQTIDQRLELAARTIEELKRAGGLSESAGREFLRGQIKEIPSVRAMWVLNARGRTIYDSDPGNVGRDLSDRAYFQIYQTQPQTTFHIETPVRSRTTGTWLISASRPLRSAQGTFAGIIVAAFEPSYFDSLWRKLDLGSGGSIALFHRDGVLMMRTPFDDAMIGRTFQNRPLFAALSTNPTGTFEDTSPMDGKHRVLSYRILSAYPDLVVVVGKSYDLVLAPWRRLAEVGLAIWAAASVAMLLLSVLLGRAWRQGLQGEVRNRHMAERLSLATDATSIAVWDWDVKTGALYASPTYFSMLGYDPGERLEVAEQWLDRVHPEDRDFVAEKFRAGLAGDIASYRYEARMRHRDGSYRWVGAATSVLARDTDGKAARLVGTREDITERKRAEAEKENEGAVLELIAHGGPLRDVLNRVLLSYETLFQGMRGSVLLLDPDGRRLRHLAAPHLPSAYCLEIDGVEIGPGVGSCGAAAYTKKTTMVADIANDPLWRDYRDLALRHGLRACWSVPILGVRGGVLGTFAFYWDSPREALPWELAAIERGAYLASLAIERHQSEDALRESKNMLQSVMEHVPARIFWKDRDSRYLGGNTLFAKDAGYNRPDELIGKTDLEMGWKDQAEVFRAEDRAVMESGQPLLDQEDSQTVSDGTKMWLNVSKAPLRDENSQIVGMLGIYQDATKRKRAEDALKASEERFRTLSEWLPEAVALHRGGKLIYINPAAVKMFGAQSARDLVGRPALDFVHPTSHASAIARAKSIASGAATISPATDERFLRLDGCAFDVAVQGRSIIYEGKPATFLAMRDVTERKRSADAVAALLREKEALLREAHHRVKNNLALITSLMRLEAGKSREGETRAALGAMQARIHSVLLLNETLYKAERYSRVALEDYLRQMATHLFRAQNPDPDGVRLVLELEPVEVHTDQAIPCGLIVNELMTNSLKHAFPGGARGEVRVNLTREPHGAARLRVGDTGIGLPEDFVVKRSASLGLQLVSDLAKQLQGDLQVGPGATFSITFLPQLDHRTIEIPAPKGVKGSA